MCIRDRLYRVFQNLIDNALKYSMDGTRIFVEILREEDDVSVCVKNTASYEMEFTEEEILERFARGDKSRTTEGNGLGLSIAKSFAEVSGGTFRVKICLLYTSQQRLVEYFGGEILLEDGNVNRKALGKRIFANEEDRIFLNSVMFPPITEQINKEVRQLRDQGYRIIVLDAPTLFESGANIICDSIVSVLADANLRQERIMERDSMSAVEAQNRMNAQKDDEFYRSRSEFIIENNGSQTELKEQVDRITAAMKEKINGN